jgi:hypothetical protein
LGGNPRVVVPYRQPGLQLKAGPAVAPPLVRALQGDLRALGYLKGGLDGDFGAQTDAAVRALQHDLLFNDGRGRDGGAPVAVRAFNEDRVTAVDGVVDERLAACIEAMLDDVRMPKLPRSDHPDADNRRALDTVRALASTDLPVPVPVLLAVLAQESGLLHFRVPSAGDPDDFIVVGLDRGDDERPDRITSRGYGIGQYTLFHHPPRPDEVAGVMTDPALNVHRAVRELREKFDHFVVSASPSMRADDRLAEIGAGPVRACRFPPGDPRFQRDCHRCAQDAPPPHHRDGHAVVRGVRRAHAAHAVPFGEPLCQRAGPRAARVRLAVRRSPLQRQRRQLLPLPGAGAEATLAQL